MQDQRREVSHRGHRFAQDRQESVQEHLLLVGDSGGVLKRQVEVGSQKEGNLVPTAFRLIRRNIQYVTFASRSPSLRLLLLELAQAVHFAGLSPPVRQTKRHRVVSFSGDGARVEAIPEIREVVGEAEGSGEQSEEELQQVGHPLDHRVE